MKTGLPLLLASLTILTISSCKTIQQSRYSKFNEFTYEAQQPSFKFENDTLKVEGEWNWATNARVIPKLSYLPKVPAQILESTIKEHGPVLFATWIPHRTKYSVAGKVPVSKKDVRFKDKNNLTNFLFVFLSEQPFKADAAKYKWRGRNNDYQFGVYSGEPKLVKENLWQMEVIADGGDMYYTFFCVLDKSFMDSSEVREEQQNRLVDDIKNYFLTQE